MQENIDDIIKEMRQIRPDCDECVSNHTCDYLSRFADRMEDVLKAERKKKRERKYEYAALYRCNGETVSIGYGHYETIEEARIFSTHCSEDETMVFVRREVGEWKEVKDV